MCVPEQRGVVPIWCAVYTSDFDRWEFLSPLYKGGDRRRLGRLRNLARLPGLVHGRAGLCPGSGTPRSLPWLQSRHWEGIPCTKDESAVIEMRCPASGLARSVSDIYIFFLGGTGV